MAATPWVMGGAWMALHIWEHYLFTLDKAFLKEYYPILRDFALFFLDFLAGRGLSAGTLPPVWGVPVLAAAAFGGGFLVWLVLRRVPVVKTYLI